MRTPGVGYRRRAAIGSHTARLSYVYLQVVEGGLMPSVPSLDVLGTDIASGKAVHEHLVQQ